MCFFPAGSAEAENTSSFTSVLRIKQNRKKNLEQNHHFFLAFKGPTPGEFVNNKPKLAVRLVSLKLLRRDALQRPRVKGVPGFVPCW